MNHRSEEHDDAWGNQEGERETSDQKASGGNAREARARYTIDRFEDNGWAILEREDGHSFEVPSEWLPDEASEGDVLVLRLGNQADSSSLHFAIDTAERDKRLKDIEALRNRIPKGPPGDIEL